MEQKKYKVFLVDDEMMIRRMIEFKLKERTDLEIHSFPSGEACIENLSLKPEIVILDYHMDVAQEGKMNGLDTLLQIVENAPDVKVAMLSSQDNVSVAVDVLKKGAVDYIVKDNLYALNAEKAIDKIIQGIELKEEIRKLTETIKRDKLLIRGYFAIGVIVALFLFYYFVVR